jgi:hypothetical protein
VTNFETSQTYSEPQPQQVETMASSLQSLIYTPASASDTASLQVLDQLKLPQDKVYISVPDIATTYNVIRNMQIRGKLVDATLQWWGRCLVHSFDLDLFTPNRSALDCDCGYAWIVG